MTDVIKQCDVVPSCVECPRYGDDCDGDKRIEPTDRISRADAICEVLVNDGIDNIVDRINALPSAEAETKCIAQIKVDTEELVRRIKEEYDITDEWIPCSERLPSESGDYLCTIPLDADETYTEVLMFHKGRFYEDDDEWGATYHDDVLAWMPLPEPYKGGDDE